WNFDSDAVGQVPEGFTVASGAWEVVEESTAPSQPNALKQTGDDTYNLIWVDGTSYKDFELIVKVQAISGNTDQGGGFVWRGVDDENYYVSRYNPRESFMSLDIRKMVDGRRTTLAQTDEAVCDFEWHTLRLVMEGDVMELYFDDDLLCEADDGTFPDAGMIGIWSKADAVTHYDDLTAKELGTGILIKKYSNTK
ncbi:MAG: hypothetical protein GY869_28435, partial [Planctomycetes bacterium]|nr:hypothetical protein [Planctomycetota bacterium]